MAKRTHPEAMHARLPAQYAKGRAYLGTLHNGVRHGVGAAFYDGTLEYEGEWQHGHPHGSGKAYFPDGAVAYAGAWQNGKQHGIGKAYAADGTLLYAGEYREGKRCGMGTSFFQDGRPRYKGSWQDGHPHGTGETYWRGGALQYVGKWCKGVKYGCGKLYRREGMLGFEGMWANDKPHGQGKAYYATGALKYAGEYEHGKYEGRGASYKRDGTLAFDGDWKEGMCHGQGTKFWSNGTPKYAGEWRHGVRHYPSEEPDIGLPIDLDKFIKIECQKVAGGVRYTCLHPGCRQPVWYSAGKCVPRERKYHCDGARGTPAYHPGCDPWPMDTQQANTFLPSEKLEKRMQPSKPRPKTFRCHQCGGRKKGKAVACRNPCPRARIGI